ncbi:hypothetical protein C7I87_14195 [Mesorhizobium sp. SARCC-RB16n]|uniref:hypothetical protein n=1 Tax=Mesorhizobium sp. SARCC-RB16n TaxID=2116687 RepID=UPI00122EB73D|nr:hypothetical protein [Mesorhizobium sp. SARCC-RB16n]KAA3450090.1 hypothetical protein C7I87_14195 [Mesorhizobium sp. SARCC-RB16n]
MANTVHDTTVKLLLRDYPSAKTKKFRSAVAAIQLLDMRFESPSYPAIDIFDRNTETDEDMPPLDWVWFLNTAS